MNTFGEREDIFRISKVQWLKRVDKLTRHSENLKDPMGKFKTIQIKLMKGSATLWETAADTEADTNVLGKRTPLPI